MLRGSNLPVRLGLREPGPREIVGPVVEGKRRAGLYGGRFPAGRDAGHGEGV